jgi:thioredoxin 1
MAGVTPVFVAHISGRDTLEMELMIPMPFDNDYSKPEPTREEIDRLPGPVLLEFGTGWCGYCQAIQRPLEIMLSRFSQIRHIKVEDGKGRPLGRSFRVKLWPNLVFLRDGRVRAQLARPEPEEIQRELEALTKELEESSKEKIG